MIKLNHLEKYFFKNKRNEIHVISDTSLDLPDSGLVVFLGPSGSGKTTLLNIIGGLDKVESGTITFDDDVIRGYHANKWDEIRNEHIGYIFQNYNLLSGLSIYENVAFVLRLQGITDEEKIAQNVNYILKAVGMFKFRKKKASQLSGGQQQRVAIARALVKNPMVVIADEPTGNLDSKNTYEIMKIIKEISATKLVVLVTHERELANIYADRIIELQDGKIISDQENESSTENEHLDENVVYLKDLNQTIDHEDDNLTFKMYSEKETEEPVKVRFLVRNKTLYIDVDSNYKKVKLLDSNSSLVLKDEHYKKPGKEDFTRTSFDSEYLDLSHTKKSKKLFTSAKQVVSMAFEKVLRATLGGKLLLISFIISGAMIALTMGLAANFFVPNPNSMIYNNDYVIGVLNARTNSYTAPTYDKIKEIMGEDDFINLGSKTSFSVVDKQNDAEFFKFQSNLDLYENLERPSIAEGRLATEKNEIMITTTLADSLLDPGIFGYYNPTYAQQYGIWNYSDFLEEKILSNGVEYAITGVVNSEQSLIYVSKDAYYSFLSTVVSFLHEDEQSQFIEISINYSYIENILGEDLLYGSMPSVDGGIVATDGLIRTLGLADLLDDATSWPQTIDEIGNVYGVIDDDNSKVWTNATSLEQKVFEEMNRYGGSSFFIHTNDAKTLINRIETSFDNYSAYKETDYAIKSVMENGLIVILIPMVLIILGTSVLGFYFLMHSRMISRIYEISVYRSLGMKKRDLFVSHILEATFLTTITSLIGYLIASWFLISIANSPFGGQIFIVSPLSVFVGVIVVYICNVGSGAIPMLALLRKTPSEIASKYDI